MGSTSQKSQKPSRGSRGKSRGDRSTVTNALARDEFVLKMAQGIPELENDTAAYFDDHQTPAESASECSAIKPRVGIANSDYPSDRHSQTMPYAFEQSMTETEHSQMVTNHAGQPYNSISTYVVGLQEATAQDHQPLTYMPPNPLRLYATQPQQGPTLHRTANDFNHHAGEQLTGDQFPLDQDITYGHQLQRWAYETSKHETTLADRLEKSNWEGSCPSSL
ncbi:hypothetical protein B0O99DRAFT_91421 [Bisporella sp. PMI_857]|nr:hypothetical protein B0O99DRAFT_91421 [Bisporella sp. PMI_857]